MTALLQNKQINLHSDSQSFLLEIQVKEEMMYSTET